MVKLIRALVPQVAGLALASLLFSPCLVQGQERAAADRQATGETRPPIRLTQCRVQLVHEAILASERTGVIDNIAVSEGDTVRAHQIVASLRDTAAQSAFVIAGKQAGNDVDIRFARKSSDLANAELIRSLQANKEVPGTFPELEVRKLRMAAEKALLQIEQAEHQFLIAELKRDEAGALLHTYRVEVPFDGVVTKVHRTRGEAAREGEPIVEIASTRYMRVEGFLDVPVSYHVKRNAAVEVRIDVPATQPELGQMVFRGRVEFVDVKVQPVAQKIRVWAEVANYDELLKDGLTASMTIYPDQMVPKAPILGENDPRSTLRK